MLLSKWKSSEEIEFSLKNFKHVAVFACTVCANLSGTGGQRGLKLMQRRLEEWDKKVVVAKTINVCCVEEILDQAVRIHLDPVAGKCDALVMLSCAGGIKTAFLCNPGIPVVAALDSTGSGSVTRRNDPVAQNRCIACNHCVLTYTGGICPISECALKKKYEPCNQAPENENFCTMADDRLCVWKEIAKRGDLALLKELGHLHHGERYLRIPRTEIGITPSPLRKISGWFMARIPGISHMVDLLM